MLYRYLIAEILKLRRSLALMLCLAAPACVAALGAMIAIDGKSGGTWQRFMMGNAALWSFAMLPMAVTALSVLLAQMEHGPKTWNHLLALPGARPWAFLAKALVMLGLVALMTAFLFAMLTLAGWLSNVIAPDSIAGPFDAGRHLKLLGGMVVASLLVCMLQLWVALAFRSFVPPLAFGIAGTMVAIGATAAKQGIFFPWLLATNMLSTPDRQAQALIFGGGGGLIVLAAMLLHLSRRDA